MFKIDEALMTDTPLWAWNSETQQIEFKYKDEIQDEFKALFERIFDGISTEPSTPQGQIITTLTQLTLACIAKTENQANGIFLGGFGERLDAWAWQWFRVERHKAQNSSAVITITGIPNTFIPAGFQVTDAENSLVYETKSDYIIGANGEVDATIYCVELTDKISPRNAINTMITIIAGVERVNNAEASTPALFAETDDALFNRCVYYGANAKNATFKSIMASVANCQGLEKLPIGYENFTDEPVTFKEVEVSPHSIAIVVLGGDNNDIAQAIYQSRPTGCGMDGNTSIDINTDDGVKYTFSFYRPSEVALSVSVVVDDTTNIVPQNYEQIISDNIKDFIKSLDISAQITQPALAKYLYKNVKDFEINDVKLAKTGEPLGYAPISLKLTEYATISDENITIQRASEL